MRSPERRQNRLPGYDYSREGVCFVTTCPWDRAKWFGTVADGEVVLNSVGRIIAERWQWLATQYPQRRWGRALGTSFLFVTTHHASIPGATTHRPSRGRVATTGLPLPSTSGGGGHATTSSGTGPNAHLPS